jgi:hypothetical protein
MDFVHCPEFLRARKHNVLETGFVSFFRFLFLLGHLEIAKLNCWTANG